MLDWYHFYLNHPGGGGGAPELSTASIAVELPVPAAVSIGTVVAGVGATAGSVVWC